MNILLTRPKAASARTAARFRQAGHRVHLLPLFDIEFENRIDLSWDRYQAVAFTSANAVEAIVRAEVPVPARLPCFCVGERTAEAAGNAGFRNLFTAAHNLASLADLIRVNMKPAPAVILHLRGEIVAGDLNALLDSPHISIDPVIVYRTRAAPGCEAEVRLLLEQNAARPPSQRIEAVAFYSPRTASLFADLVHRTATAGHLETVTALCLSDAVADRLKALPFKAVKIAATPSTQGLIDLIKTPEM